MAKWGEGDPRWIVEERPDATNVNNWHWTEKNASQWSKDKLKELFAGLKLEDSVCVCEVTELSKCEGEAVANNRKAKLIFFYEWVLVLKWKGRINGSDVEVKGKIEIPNLSEEHQAEDVDVTVTVKTDSEESEILKEFLRTKGTEKIRELLAEYIRTLKEEFSQGMILPMKDINTTKKDPSSATRLNTGKKKALNGSRNNTNSDVCIETKQLKMKENLKCTAEDFFRALTMPEMVQAFTQSACLVEPVKGGHFEMFDGNIIGKFMEIEPKKRIVQSWRFRSWPEGHYSEVTIEIEQKEDSTEVNLIHKGIPATDYDRTLTGWKKYYWDSMKRTFGFGAILL